MKTKIYVHLLPRLCPPEDFSGGIAVVIDILRATTTITEALANGARAVYPTPGIDEALDLAKQFSAAEVLLGGERGGKKIDGFDLDNSPFSCRPEIVANKQIVFTTTNGTRAMAHCRLAKKIFLGAFSTISALVHTLSEENRQTPAPVHLLCAGTDGQITHEDTLFAGAVAQALLENSPEFVPGNDQTRLARDTFLAHSSSFDIFYAALLHSRGGQNLADLHFEHDIKRAAEWDLCKIVPKYDPESGKITATADTIQQPVQKIVAPR